MQWRMLARRCPSGSMTLVGDPGQASRPGALASWDDVLRHVPTHNPPQFVTLSVNYRTPAEVMERRVPPPRRRGADGRAVAVGAQHRRGPAIRRDDSRARSTRETADVVRSVRERTGTLAVIAPRDMHASLEAALRDLGAVAGAAEALDAPIAILDATRRQRAGVRPRRGRRTEPARHRRTGPASACSTSRSPVRRSRSSSCTRARCPKGSHPSRWTPRAEPRELNPRWPRQSAVSRRERCRSSLRPRRVPNLTTPSLVANSVSSLALPDVEAGVQLGAALADDDRAGDHRLDR